MTNPYGASGCRHHFDLAAGAALAAAHPDWITTLRCRLCGLEVSVDEAARLTRDAQTAAKGLDHAGQA